MHERAVDAAREAFDDSQRIRHPAFGAAGDAMSGAQVVAFGAAPERLRLAARPTPAARRLVDLAGELSVRLATALPETLDRTLTDTLRLVAEELQLDCAMLWQKGAPETSALLTHSWTRHLQPAPSLSLELASLSFMAACWTGEAVWFGCLDEVPERRDRELFLRCGLRSAAMVPVVLTGDTPGSCGMLAVGSREGKHPWQEMLAELHLMSGIVSQALARQHDCDELRRARDELLRLRGRPAGNARRERRTAAMLVPARRRDSANDAMRSCLSEARECGGHPAIIGRSPAIRRVLAQARQVAATNATVLLLGETGAGKELVATHIHELSARRSRPMVRVNCAAIPSTLIESELFGREKGAYTGADARQIGRFEVADRSTLLLDEIGELTPDVQVKLLRVLEDRRVERLGSSTGIPVDVRIIAATHRDLEQRLSENTFRHDLFYRLNVFPIRVPPLRERVEDIELLVWRFVDEFAASFGKRIEAIAPDTVAALRQYAWPGNIRELRNLVERAMILATSPELSIPLPHRSAAIRSTSVALADVEREHVLRVLESSHWRIRGAGGAAERLGLRPTTLETRMARLGLSRPRPVEPVDSLD